MKRKPQFSLCDSKEIFRSAELFWDVGFAIAKEYSFARKSDKLSSFDSNRLIVAGVNCVLAIELFFKGISQFHNSKFLYTHDLSILFNSLSGSIRKEIVEMYEKGIKLRDGSLPVIKRDNIVLGQGIENDPFNNDDDIESVLRIHKDGFIDWRYSFDKDFVSSIYADFSNLSVLALTLSTYSKSIMNSKLE